MRPKPYLFPAFEILEERLPLSGNVNVVLSGNNLNITGDELNNWFKITQVAATNTLHIAGTATNILRNGGGAAAFQDVVIPDFTKLSINIRTGDGTDFVEIGDAAAEAVAIAKLKVDTGAVLDTVRIVNTQITGTSRTNITLGNKENGENALIVEGSTFNAGVKVRGTTGFDVVRFEAGTNVNGKLDINTYGNGDDITLQNGNYGQLRLRAGDGSDRVMVDNVNLTNDSGTTLIDLGDDGDHADTHVNNVTAANAVQIKLGSDAPGATNTLNSTNLTSAKSIKISGGNGNDTVGLNTLHAPTVDIRLGNGNDQLGIGGLAADAAVNPASLMIDLGGGDDAMTASNINAATANIKLGAGTNLANATTVTAVTRLTLTGGNGKDTVTVGVLTSPNATVDLGAGDGDQLTASLLTIVGGASPQLTLKGGSGVLDKLVFDTTGSVIPIPDKSGFEIEIS